MMVLSAVDIRKKFEREDFLGRKLGSIMALKGVSIRVSTGEILALVGESGSGKSTLAKIICGMEKADSGEISWNVKSSHPAQMVFQNPFESLNPRLSIGYIIREALAAAGLKKRERKSASEELLKSVGLEGINPASLPHQFSGGQRQRIAIARALALSPELLVCDEAVSSLDISVQAQIIGLLKEINSNSGIPIIFIAHDLEAVSMIADRIAVMQDGLVVEEGATSKIIQSPSQEYTQELIEAVPVNPSRKKLQ
ncbi:MAG: ABC transporter ATP-binding protein [Elusimicrobia bacterium]|nr:ABC transporter ATP-binding protein [Elusimicrobiota bacterium]